MPWKSSRPNKVMIHSLRIPYISLPYGQAVWSPLDSLGIATRPSQLPTWELLWVHLGEPTVGREPWQSGCGSTWMGTCQELGDTWFITMVIDPFLTWPKFMAPINTYKNGGKPILTTYFILGWSSQPKVSHTKKRNGPAWHFPLSHAGCLRFRDPKFSWFMT